MSHELFGLGWSPLLMQERNSQDIPEQALPKDPTELLVAGIVNRNPSVVAAAIDAGVDLKQMVGKDKMAVFAIRHFQEDVITLLAKNGVSFKDVLALSEAIFASDNLPAWTWFSQQPHVVRVMEDKTRSGNTYVLKKNLIEMAPIAILESIVVDPKKNSFLLDLLNSWGVSSILVKAIPNRNSAVVDFLMTCGAFSEALGSYLNQYATQMSLHDMASLEWLAQKTPAFGSALSRALKSVVIEENIRLDALNLLGIEGEALKKSSSSHFRSVSLKPSSMVELLAASGNPLVIDLATEMGADKVAQSFLNSSSPQSLLILMCSKASKPFIKEFLKTYPQILSWRDGSNSNVLHYTTLMSMDYNKSISKTLVETLGLIDHNLCFEANNKGIIPIACAPAEAQAKLQKKIISKELGKEALRRGQATGGKRRM